MVSPVQQVVDQAGSEINRIKYRNKRKNQTKESKQPKKNVKGKIVQSNP
jgi:hypothetical protein